MTVDDPAVREMIRRAMVARIATLSGGGRPSITSLYFIPMNGHVWLGTADWTLAAREARADPRVSVLFQLEHNSGDRRILRISGQATVTTDEEIQKAYRWRVALKYILNPGGIANYATHWRQYRLMDQYHAQSAEKGKGCVIDVTPELAEYI
ncbi:MAG: pyridoxamine 5'-phosphate oxidase family protein [Anaerolineae bacterium]|nr:pyridoxamine 5'-phosphate oxidase family protein [Anaerolineae bacterium]